MVRRKLQSIEHDDYIMFGDNVFENTNVDSNKAGTIIKNWLAGRENTTVTEDFNGYILSNPDEFKVAKVYIKEYANKPVTLINHNDGNVYVAFMENGNLHGLSIDGKNKEMIIEADSECEYKFEEEEITIE